jgi:hypothetical protein
VTFDVEVGVLPDEEVIEVLHLAPTRCGDACEVVRNAS